MGGIFIKNVRTITLTAVLTALTVVGDSLTKIVIVPGILDIRFGFIFFSVIAYLFGPIVAFAAGLIQNTVSFFISGSGVFDIRYGLNAGLTGIIYAIFLYRKNYKSEYFIIWITAAKASVNLICHIIINGYLLKEYYIAKGANFEIWTSLRIFKNVGMLPVEILIMLFVLKAVSKPAINFKFIKPRKNTKKL